LACVLEDAADLLLVLTLLVPAAGAVEDSTVMALTAGDETADASMDAIDAAGLEPAVDISAVIVGTTGEVITCASSTGASTIGG
jgi:hypothetical protein